MSNLVEGESRPGAPAMVVAVAALVAPAMVNGLIDGLVTPEGLSRSIARQNLAPADHFPIDRISWAFFASPTSFRVMVRLKNNQVAQFWMIPEWLNWRITRVAIPTDVLTALYSSPTPTPASEAEKAYDKARDERLREAEKMMRALSTPKQGTTSPGGKSQTMPLAGDKPQ